MKHLFLLPIIIFCDLIILSWFAELVRQPNGIAVGAAIVLISAALYVNYKLITFIFSGK